MRSHARASSQPPPEGEAITAAMVGMGSCLELEHDAVAERGELARLRRRSYGGHLRDVRAGHEGLVAARR